MVYAVSCGCFCDVKRASVFLMASVAALFSPLAIAPASAFDFFGLLGSEEDAPPPSPETLPYKLEITGVDDDKALAQNLKDASNVWRLRLQAPASGAGLTRRVVDDFPNLADALWASGYFDARVEATVAGVEIYPDGRGIDAASSAAEGFRNKAPVSVTINIDPGPLFHLRHVVVFDARTLAPIDPTLFSKKAFERAPEAPARAAALRAMQAEWVDELRQRSYPLAKIVKTEPVVQHREHALDVAVTIDPGPRAGIGEVRLSGSHGPSSQGTGVLPDAPIGVPDDVIRSFIYLEEGEDYSPKKLADTRKSISRIEALGSVKVEDGEPLDQNGNLPILVETSERKQHAVGFSGQISNTDGPGLRAYWMDRNVFGEGERLRFDLQGGLAPTVISGGFFSLPPIDAANLIGSAKMSFVKPALYGSRDDLLVDTAAVRERTQYYWANYGNASVGIRHRFSDAASVQAGVEFEGGQYFDVWGPHDYSLLGFPLSANYDSTDSLLAPTTGVRANATVEPYVKALGDSVGMVQSKGQVTGYYALDDDAWYILAGRVTAGSIVGASVEDIPASHLFFAGGGGSVRGYRYRSLAPDYNFGFPVGGRSLLEGSAEARIKLTQEIGIVPFFDTGMAFASPFPDFQNSMRESVGLGLRYYTGIGPIRLDVATPIARQPGDSPFALFIGIGEAF